jgi:hypothetical protein
MKLNGMPSDLRNGRATNLLWAEWGPMLGNIGNRTRAELVQYFTLLSPSSTSRY